MFLMFGCSLVFPWIFAGSRFFSVSAFQRFGAFGAGEAKYPFPQRPKVLELRRSRGEEDCEEFSKSGLCEEFSKSGLSDGRDDFEGSVDFSEGRTKWDYGRISDSSSELI